MDIELSGPSNSTSSDIEKANLNHALPWAQTEEVQQYYDIRDGNQPSNRIAPDPWGSVTANLDAMGVELAPPPPRRDVDLPTMEKLPGLPLSGTVLDLRSNAED